MADPMVNKEQNPDRARALKGLLLRNDILHQVEGLADDMPQMIANLRSRVKNFSVDPRAAIAALETLRYYSEGGFEAQPGRPRHAPGTQAGKPWGAMSEPAIEDDAHVG